MGKRKLRKSWASKKKKPSRSDKIMDEIWEAQKILESYEAEENWNGALAYDIIIDQLHNKLMDERDRNLR